MSKLKLAVEALTVETFAASTGEETERGTVRAHACAVCGCNPCWCTGCDTCQASCYGTCVGWTCADTCTCPTRPIECGPLIQLPY